MTHASVFTGIGGFEIAAEVAGFDNIFHCETDCYCRKVLHRRFPKSYSYEDITEANFRRWNGKINVLSGGDPCQPHSIAGARRGTADARYLWPHMLRAAQECRPDFILNENVPGTVSNGVPDNKISDLEAIGYTCWPALIIPAGAGQAIHRRDRVWLVAHAGSKRSQKLDPASFTTRPAQGLVRYNALRTAASRYESGTPDKSCILRMADGFPDRPYRNPRIKALGNAIDWRIALPFFQTFSHIIQQ